MRSVLLSFAWACVAAVLIVVPAQAGAQTTTVGGGSVGVGAGASVSHQQQIGNSSVNMGVGASASVEICMPSFQIPVIPDLQIDITVPRIPDFYLEISLADPRMLFWLQIFDYKAWLAALIASLEARLKAEVCTILQEVRMNAEDTYSSLRSGAFETLMPREFISSTAESLGGRAQPVEARAAASLGKRLERDFSKRSIDLTEQIYKDMESLISNPINKMFYPTDVAMQELRRRYICELEAQFCGYSDECFPRQPIDRRLADLEDYMLSMEIELADISSILNNAINAAAQMIQDMIDDLFGQVMASVATLYYPMCVYTPVYCFCYDLFTHLPINDKLEEAYGKISDRLWEEADKLTLEPIPNVVRVEHRALTSRTKVALEHRRNFIGTLPPAELYDHVTDTQRAARELREARKVLDRLDIEVEKLVPYVQPEDAPDYADRFSPGHDQPEAFPWLPESNTEIASAFEITIHRMFEQSRFSMKEYLGGVAVRMLAQEMEWSESARATLTAMTESVGDSNRTGNMKQELLAQRVILDIERKLLESSLRQEVLLSLLIITKRGQM
ncbi:MAG: hypothetical protein IBX50_06040 [Marinospirillum sp.]|uniref:hypothetical protein n=1 Tax=Marinospirillum sp. TaxID=2183934 RepID=UPI0019F1D9B8|nr:hypothetical protein [Marinospirillum sp.]MBE0506267.1 hypothetical protein [Marinospirillum sp.]